MGEEAIDRPAIVLERVLVIDAGEEVLEVREAGGIALGRNHRWGVGAGQGVGVGFDDFVFHNGVGLLACFVGYFTRMIQTTVVNTGRTAWYGTSISEGSLVIGFSLPPARVE